MTGHVEYRESGFQFGKIDGIAVADPPIGETRVVELRRIDGNVESRLQLTNAANMIVMTVRHEYAAQLLVRLSQVSENRGGVSRVHSDDMRILCQQPDVVIVEGA